MKDAVSGSGAKRARALFTAAVTGWFLMGAGAAIAQDGAIAGRVTHGSELRPLAGVQVVVQGTTMGAQTNNDGTYRIDGVPAGEHTLRTTFIGFRPAEQVVTVVAGQVSTADFALTETAIGIGGITVTGTLFEVPDIMSPISVQSIDVDDVPALSADVSGLLAGKGPGIAVTQGSGQPGQAANIMLRGPTSLTRGETPLIVVDNIIQDGSLSDINSLDVETVEWVAGASAAALYGSRAQNGVIQIRTKRGTALNTNTVNFVLRGEGGLGQLANGIRLNHHHPFELNDAGTKFIDTNGDEVDFGDLGALGFGSAVLDNQIDPAAPGSSNTAFSNKDFPGEMFDHMDTYFDPGETFDGYAAVTARFGESSFRVSLNQFVEEGIISCSRCADNLEALNADREAQGLVALTPDGPDDDGYSRQNARANVDTRFGDFDVAASTFFSRADQDDRTLGNEFLYLTFMSPALDIAQLHPDDGRPDIDIDPQSVEPNPLYELAIRDTRDKRTRTSAAVDANFSPAGLPWFTVESNFSFDRTDFFDYTIAPKDQVSAGCNRCTTGGSLREYNYISESINASVTLGAQRVLMDGDLTLRMKARYLLETSEERENQISGSAFSVIDVPNFAAITGDISGSNEINHIRSEGMFGIVSGDYLDRYIFDGLIRRDGSSLFGPDERWQTYYRGAVAWRVAQEDFWNIDAITELKLRFAIGTAGGRPGFSWQYETYGVSQGIVTPIRLGNAALRPEVTTERDASMEMLLFDNIGFDVTYAWQDTEDQLLRVPQPAYVGYSSQYQNAGRIESHTYEVALNYAAIDNEDMTLTMRAGWDKTVATIARLDVPAYTSGNFYFAEGRQLGEMWGEKWATSCDDLSAVGIGGSDCEQFEVNDDGLLVAVGSDNDYTDGFSEALWGSTVDFANMEGTDVSYAWGLPIKVDDYSPACIAKNPDDYMEMCPLTQILPIGNGTPDFSTNLQTNLRYKAFTFATLLEARVGHDVYNTTQQWSLRSGRGSIADQGDKAPEFQKPVAYARALYSVNADNSWFAEKGDWLKLREFSLGYTLPRSFTESTLSGVFDRVTLNLIGRNLLTFTGFTGYDPEVGGGGSLGALNAVGGSGYPNFRTVTISAELVF